MAVAIGRNSPIFTESIPLKVPVDSDYRKGNGERVSSPAIAEAITQDQDEHLTACNLVPLTRLNYDSDQKQRGRYLTERLGLVHVDRMTRQVDQQPPVAIRSV